MNNESIKSIRYVALGDSYTICTGASWEESWPILLTNHLNQKGISTELIANPSVDGWTSKDLIEKELPIFDASDPDFATLLIGVNDWVQKFPAETFQRNIQLIMDRIQSHLKIKTNLILVTIPDFGVTPKGAKYSGGRDISKGISEFNGLLIAEAQMRNISIVDIFDETQKMKNNPDLISSDDLHPSAKEYAIWETMIFPVAFSLLSK